MVAPITATALIARAYVPPEHNAADLFEIAWFYGFNAGVARRRGETSQARRDGCRSAAALVLARRLRDGGTATTTEIETLAQTFRAWVPL